MPGDETVITGGRFESIGGVADQTTQLNVGDGGGSGTSFKALSGGKVNINGGRAGGGFQAFSGSEVNIRGGVVSSGVDANAGSVVYTSGGNIVERFEASCR